MQCPRCHSDSINVQAVTETQLKTKKKSLLYWITVGWFIEPLLWIFLTLPKLIFELFSPRKVQTKTKTKKMAICQNCGHSWKI